MTKNNSNNSTDAGVSTILLVVFVVLKLVGVITWPWVWVLAPLWIPLIVVGLVMVALFALGAAAAAFDS